MEDNSNANRKIVLQRLKLGESATEIEKYVTIKAQQINKIKKKLIEEGKITQKEIDEAKENAKIEKERKRLQEDSDIQKMLEYVRQGLSFVEISKQEDIPWERTKISRDIQKCIKFGIITEQEIEQARKQREEEEKEKNPDRQRILVLE